jgi:hypothetical protein
MAYPNVNIDFLINPAQDNAGDSGAFWGKKKRYAKGQELASKILYKWGFAYLPEGEDPPKYFYGNGDNKYFEGLGYEINSRQVRQLISCEEIDGTITDINNKPNGLYNAIDRDEGFLGGASQKNAKIDKVKWKLVKSVFISARMYQDSDFQPCPIEFQEEAYLNALDFLTKQLESAQKPMSNLTIMSIIGGAVAASAVLLTKYIK